jgi:hypothetical protein
MNRQERWILEAACTLAQPVRALIGEGVEEWFNRPHHGLDPAGVVNVLRKLLREGLIVLFPGQGGDALIETEDELRRLLEGDYRAPPFKATYYGLTAAGGAAWEEVARPDWDRYIDVSFGTDPDEGEVICADPARAEDYVFSPHQEHAPLPDSIRRDRLEPWPATYWKTLPMGHRLRFLYDPNHRVDAAYGSDSRVSRQAWLEDANRWFTPDGS